MRPANLELRQKIINFLTKQANPDLRTIGEISKGIVGTRNPKFQEYNRMMRLVRWHSEALVREGTLSVEKKSNAHIYTIKAGAKAPKNRKELEAREQ